MKARSPFSLVFFSGQMHSGSVAREAYQKAQTVRPNNQKGGCDPAAESGRQARKNTMRFTSIFKDEQPQLQ
jgi:hypothetical protein